MSDLYGVVATNPNNVLAPSLFGLSLLSAADGAAARTALGLGTMATQAAADYLPLAGGTLTGPLTGSGGVIEQRNGSTAQVLRVYSTYTDASNYERLAFNHSSGQIEIAAETAGTGTDNISLLLTTAGNGSVISPRPIIAGQGGGGAGLRTDAINSYDNGYTLLQNVAGLTKLFGNGYAILTAGSAGLALGLATGDKVGFYGVTPVVQQVLATGAGRTVDDVISFLQTIGACKQS